MLTSFVVLAVLVARVPVAAQAPAAAQESPVARAFEQSEPLTLLVDVVARDDGEPVSGVRVWAVVGLEHWGSRSSGERFAAHGSRTNDRGLAEFVFDEPRVIDAILVDRSASTAMHYEQLVTPLTLAPDAQSFGRLAAEVGRGATLSGQVLDLDGAPFVGARVHVSSELPFRLGNAGDGPTTSPGEEGLPTDAEGRFTLSALDSDFLLSASAPGHLVIEELRGSFEEGAAYVGADMVLAPTRVIEGTVHFPDGTPAAGVQLGGLPTKPFEAEQASLRRARESAAPGAIVFGEPAGTPATVGASGEFRLKVAGRYARVCAFKRMLPYPVALECPPNALSMLAEIDADQGPFQLCVQELGKALEALKDK